VLVVKEPGATGPSARMVRERGSVGVAFLACSVSHSSNAIRAVFFAVLLTAVPPLGLRLAFLFASLFAAASTMSSRLLWFFPKYRSRASSDRYAVRIQAKRGKRWVTVAKGRVGRDIAVDVAPGTRLRAVSQKTRFVKPGTSNPVRAR
jgi:hypothetical protein